MSSNETLVVLGLGLIGLFSSLSFIPHRSITKLDSSNTSPVSAFWPNDDEPSEPNKSKSSKSKSNESKSSTKPSESESKSTQKKTYTSLTWRGEHCADEKVDKDGKVGRIRIAYGDNLLQDFFDQYKKLVEDKNRPGFSASNVPLHIEIDTDSEMHELQELQPENMSTNNLLEAFDKHNLLKLQTKKYHDYYQAALSIAHVLASHTGFKTCSFTKARGTGPSFLLALTCDRIEWGCNCASASASTNTITSELKCACLTKEGIIPKTCYAAYYDFKPQIINLFYTLSANNQLRDRETYVRYFLDYYHWSTGFDRKTFPPYLEMNAYDRNNHVEIDRNRRRIAMNLA